MANTEKGKKKKDKEKSKKLTRVEINQILQKALEKKSKSGYLRVADNIDSLKKSDVRLFLVENPDINEETLKSFLSEWRSKEKLKASKLAGTKGSKIAIKSDSTVTITGLVKIADQASKADLLPSDNIEPSKSNILITKIKPKASYPVKEKIKHTSPKPQPKSRPSKKKKKK